MSTGDIDDKIIDPSVLDNLRKENPDLDAYLKLAWAFLPNHQFFIPYGAGISEDGRRVYISYDIQTIVSGVECDRALVRHETTEWGLRHYLGIGEDYHADPEGHRIANGAEFARVEELIGRPGAIELYEQIIDEQVLRTERTDVKGKPIPQDLALYPYLHDQDLVDRLEEEMWNDRSIEEWNKLNPQIPLQKTVAPPAKPKEKLKRDAFLYLHPDGDKQCATCRDWITIGKCYIHSPDVDVTGSASCGLYVYGKPRESGIPISSVTPEESGLVNRPVRCENCRWGGPNVYVCALFEMLNQRIPSAFELDINIDPKGCCNAQQPRT